MVPIVALPAVDESEKEIIPRLAVPTQKSEALPAVELSANVIRP
jgi:hypothetical protein